MHRLLAALLLAPLATALAQSPRGGTAAAAPPSQTVGSTAPSIPYEMYKLPNGLEVILAHDPLLPVVTANIWYHVGAFHEQRGRTGFAHLFEHMMFQGSKHIGDDVHLAMLAQVGGTDINASTSFDRTDYHETVPTNHLETVLWLESDRMGFLLDALDQKKLENQQEVVKNERRQRTETAPYGLAFERFWKALFPEPHPYSGLVIGSMKDLDAATLEDVRGFFQKWYAPANATLVLVGDFDEAQARELVEKYFGTLPGGPRPAAPEVRPVALEKPVELRHQEELGQLPRVYVGWLSPSLFQPGDAAADVLSAVLASGKSSRLYERLVFTKQLAQSVSAYQQSLGAQSVFVIDATARPGVTTEQLLEEIDAVLGEVREKGVSADEVQRVRNKIETGIISDLQESSSKADRLQSYNHYLGDPGRLQWDLARYEAVAPDQVRDFARQVLTDKRVVLHAVPGAQGPAASPAGSPAQPNVQPEEGT